MIAFWRKVVVTLGYIASGIIIFAAVVVSVTRLLTPILNDHLADFEKYASRLLDRPVHIQQVAISWNIYEPELALQNVVLLDQQTQKPSLTIPLIKINLAIWRSLLSVQPIMESMTISGLHITLHQKTSGQISMEGFNDFAMTDNFTGQAVSANAVFAWIFSQSNLILRDISIQFIREKSEEKLVNVTSLSLHNTTNHHELIGNAELSQSMPTDVAIDFKWKGSITDLAHVKASLYLYLKGISLPQWLGTQTWHDLSISDGIGSAKITAIWNNNTWENIQTALQFYDIQAQSKTVKQPIEISRISGNIDWRREGDNQIISGENILINWPNHLWPSTNFTCKYALASDGSVTIQQGFINYLDLSDAASLIIKSGLLPANYQAWVTQLHPQGEIHELNTNWNGKEGNFKLNSQSTSVTINQIFDNPLSIDKLFVNLVWQKDASGTWIFNAKGLQAKNDDVNARADVTFTLPQNDSPHIDLSGNFTVLNAAHISHYLPLKIFKPKLLEWLQQAFESGSVVSGTAVVQGRLNDFPFDNGSGKFEISGLAQDIGFNYAPDWPSMQHANAKLNFSGRAMTIDLTKGQILNVPITSAHADIPFLGDAEPAILTVQGNVQTDLQQGLQFIHQSPLENTVGKNLSALDMQGPTQLNLNLTIPLAEPKDTKVEGKAVISNAILRLPSWNLLLDKLNGSFNFTDDSISASNMTGALFSHPLQLSLATEHPTGKPAYVTADLQSVVSEQDLKNWLALPVTQVIQGTTRYHAQLQLPPQGKTSQPTVLNIQSDLQGMAVILPDSYGKTADSKSDFQLSVLVNDDQPLKTKLSYNKLFSAALILKKEKQKYNLQSADINLGTGEANWQNQPGVIITGNWEQIDWDKVKPYVTQFTSTKKPAANSLITPDMFRGVDVVVNTVNFSGLKLKRMRVQLSRSGSNRFLLGLSNAEMDGQITIPNPGSDQAIQARFKYLHFTPDVSDSTVSNMNPKDLPPISFVGNDVHYADMDLGQVTFNLVPNSRGLAIKQLELTSKAYELHASGEWTGSKTQSASHLQGNIKTSNVTDMLNAWGFTHANLMGKQGNADFDLSWTGAPFNPSARSLSGTLSLKLGAGSIVNLSEETNAKMGLGKILNVFSLQSLPRRLSLNFSDVFEKGYSFDSMKGDFNFRNGSAFTQNTRFDGPIAGIQISGRIGLIAKDFDMKLNVTPYVTGSLPVVAAIATVNPLAGLATWLVGHAVSNIITYNYSITGPWDNPVWTQVGTQKSAKPVTKAAPN